MYIQQQFRTIKDAEEAILKLLDLPYLSSELKLELLTLSWEKNEELYKRLIENPESKVVSMVLTECRDRYYSLSKDELLQIKGKICGLMVNQDLDHLINLLKSNSLTVTEEGEIMIKILEVSSIKTHAELARILGRSRSSISYRIKKASEKHSGSTIVKKSGRPRHIVIDFERLTNLPLKVIVKKNLGSQHIAEILRYAAAYMDRSERP